LRVVDPDGGRDLVDRHPGTPGLSPPGAPDIALWSSAGRSWSFRCTTPTRSRGR